MQILSWMIGLCLLTSPVHADELVAETIGVFDWIPKPETIEGSPNVTSVLDFKLHSIQVTRDQAGLDSMRILFPEDLSAGQPLWISLREVRRDPNSNLIEFAGDAGSASCEVESSWKSGGCDVSFTGLQVSSTKMAEFLKAKYQGTPKAVGMDTVAQAFSAEPFGKIQILDAEFETPGSQLGNGTWRSEMRILGGNWQKVRTFFDFDRGAINSSEPIEGIGLQNVLLSTLEYEYSLSQLTGVMFVSSEKSLWFRIEFNGDQFVGVWGDVESPATTMGEWRGHR